MFGRRDLFRLALGGAVAGASGVTNYQATAQTGLSLADPTPFTPDVVVNMARELAKAAYVAPVSDLPEPFAKLTYEQYVAIRLKTKAIVWASQSTGFALEPLHRGFIFATPMTLHLVDEGIARRVVYDSADYDFGRLEVPAKIPNIGFSGVRVLQLRQAEGLSEVAIFQGASFFRARARGQNLGVMARALSIRTADPKGEEFPIFRDMFIERPTLAANTLLIHALLDSPSVTGAYSFTLRPGDAATIIDTELTLFPRVQVDHFGLAPMQATFLFGPIDRRHADDVRPGVYEVKGLQIHNGNGEWLWRPVADRETLQISAFIGENPRGFGMLQRDRDFADFEDDEQHWERRPSLWIEPIDEWGAGMMELIEIPSESEVNDNIVAYWRPKQGLQAGKEASFAYRQFWCWSPPDRPSISEVRGSFGGRGSGGKQRRFVVVFVGGIFADPETVDIKPTLSAAPGTIVAVVTHLSRSEKTFRVDFEIDPGSDDYSELRLVLESAGKPVSETWLYRWTP